MFLKSTLSDHSFGNLKLVGKCPNCLKEVKFSSLSVSTDYNESIYLPNYLAINEQFPPLDDDVSYGCTLAHCPSCDAFVMLFYEVISDKYAEVIKIFPPSKADYNREGLSNMVINLLDETFGCLSAGCYRAACIMARRVLEEFCHELGYKTGRLYNRLETMERDGKIQTHVKEALHEIRIVGNDAAHVELRDFDNIGKAEAELTVRLIKNAIDSWYERQGILADIDALKKRNP